MTINRLKKRYYGLSFSIALLISVIIVFIDIMFHIFVNVPFEYNKELKTKDSLVVNEKNLYTKNIRNLEKQNNIYLNYLTDQNVLKNNLTSFFNEFTSKAKLFNINVISVEPDKEFFNISIVKISTNSINKYISDNFAIDATKELLKESYPLNIIDIKNNNNIITFKFIQNYKNEKINNNKIYKKKK